MSSGLAEQPFTPWFHTPTTRTPAIDPSREFLVARPAAGLAGGDDEPEDERRDSR